jgi:hypothetical protein
MEIQKYIQQQMAGMRRTVDMTMKDMTSELLNWAAPGTANAISATFIHFMSVEDSFFQEIIQGKASVWNSGAWSQKTGIPKHPSIGEDWSGFKHRQVAIQPLLDYQMAVWAATDTYLAAVTAKELDRKVNFDGNECTVTDMIILSVSQSLFHCGEIATLKGIQGVRGYPI